MRNDRGRGKEKEIRDTSYRDLAKRRLIAIESMDRWMGRNAANSRATLDPSHEVAELCRRESMDDETTTIE